MDMKKMNIPTVALLCASTSYMYQQIAPIGHYYPGIECKVLYSVAAGLLIYAWFDRAKPLEVFFRRAGLENNDEAPWIIKKHKKPDGCTYIVHMPPGMCMSDFENKKEAMEQFLGQKVYMHFAKDLIIEATDKKLETEYPFKLFEYPEPLKIALAYTREGLYTLDIEEGIHLMVAGTTGSGKSVTLRTITTGLMFKPQQQLKINLVDFMKVELGIFKNSSRINSFATTPEQFYQVLQSNKFECERRLELFDKIGVNQIKKYNKKSKEKLPYIVNIVDEIAALHDKKEYKYIHNELMLRCAQDRKVGIHYILCTQRPSREIISAEIKTNIPTRICCKTSSDADSEIVLDIKGAEKLRGKGHALIKFDINLVEAQIMFLDEDECEKLIEPTIIKTSKNIEDDVSGVMGRAK